MKTVFRFFALSVSILTFVLLPTLSTFAQAPVIEANDNLVRAGVLQEKTLTINLVAEEGMWHPAGIDRPGMPMQAFREESGSLQIPAPLIRVQEGTEVAATIRNAIPGAELEVHGFQSRPDTEDKFIRIPSGESRTVRFQVGEPGTYFYWASTVGRTLNARRGKDSQLSGAFIVDPAGYTPGANEHIFVLGEKRDTLTLETEGEIYAFNGRIWPYTQRPEVEVGEVNTWHFINPSFGGHPLHLHGRHYRVASSSSMLAEERFDAQYQREVVTELLASGAGMKMEWSADREGNWLFHCHISGHVNAENIYAGHSSEASGMHHEKKHDMNGMVLGIHARRSHGSAPEEAYENARKITMMMEKKDGVFDEVPGFAVSFNEAGGKKHTPVIPGPILVVNKDEPVSIEIVNHLGEPTSIHWHGMELESYYDGVAGFSGNGPSITPSIKPGESFVAKFTPPRAGTFIYHTHMDDQRQLAAGLYGAMIVSDPENPYDPEVDKVFVIGMMGGDPLSPRLEGSHLGINGAADLSVNLKAGKAYRLRIINITANNAGFRVGLVTRGAPEQWIPVAKDGADLPEAYRTPAAAWDQLVSVGETYDFSWTPKAPDFYWLEVRRGNGEWMGQARLQAIP